MSTADVTDPLLRSLVEAAVLAPSSHNTQPWVFRIGDGRIDLYADRTRALPVNDPDDRELVISCGCALFNLRVAAAARGRATQVTVCPAAGEPDLLATVVLGAPDSGDAELAPLADAIPRRRTYRERFDDIGFEPVHLQRLGAACAAEGAWLRFVEGLPARQRLVQLVAEADRLQWANEHWRRELAAWMHPRRKGDGLALPAFAAPVAQLVVRSFDMGSGIAARDQQLADESPVLAVLGTPTDTPADRVTAGQSLQHVLLEAVRVGMQASYLNQLVEVPAVRARLGEVAAGPGTPQLVLRLGYARKALAPSPRRPLEDVIEPD